jgi:hypothetical protein
MVTSRLSMDSIFGIWAIDSRTSHNYCNDLTEFKKYSITETNMIIKLGDKNEVHARKIGMVQLKGAILDRGLYILPRNGSAHPS